MAQKNSKQGDGRIRVRDVRRTSPDMKKLARVVIALAQAQAEAEAQAQQQAVDDEADGDQTAGDS